MPIVASKAMEEQTVSRVDTAVAEFEEKLLVDSEQEMVEETSPSADIQLAHADEVGPFKTAPSSVTRDVPESEQVPIGESYDVTSSLGTTPKLPSLVLLIPRR